MEKIENVSEQEARSKTLSRMTSSVRLGISKYIPRRLDLRLRLHAFVAAEPEHVFSVAIDRLDLRPHWIEVGGYPTRRDQISGGWPARGAGFIYRMPSRFENQQWARGDVTLTEYSPPARATVREAAEEGDTLTVSEWALDPVEGGTEVSVNHIMCSSLKMLSVALLLGGVPQGVVSAHKRQFARLIELIES
jgi:hypothetical protein